MTVLFVMFIVNSYICEYSYWLFHLEPVFPVTEDGVSRNNHRKINDTIFKKIVSLYNNNECI